MQSSRSSVFKEISNKFPLAFKTITAMMVPCSLLLIDWIGYDLIAILLISSEIWTKKDLIFSTPNNDKINQINKIAGFDINLVSNNIGNA